MVELKKELSLTHLIFLAVGAIIGSGIMIIPALAADIAGPGSLWVWMAIGIFAILFSLVFAELASMYPSSGGIYTYIKEAFGEFWGFLAGWISFVIGWVTIAMLTAAGLDYFGAVVPFFAQPLVKSVCGVAIIGGLTLLNLYTIKGSGRFQIIFTGVTIMSLVGLIIYGAPKVSMANYVPMGITLIPFLVAAAHIIEPFIGWESMGFLAEETKNKKAISKAIIYSTFVVVAIYIGIVAVLLGVINYRSLSGTPLLQLSGVLFGKVGIITFGVLAVSIIIGAVNSWIISHARLPYSMARDQLLPSTFARLNHKSVPKNSLIVQFTGSAVIFLFLGGAFKSILETLIPLAILIYGFVVIAYIKLRREKHPSFNTHIGKFVPIVIIPVLLAILAYIPYQLTNVFIAIAAVSLCIPFYIQLKMQKDRSFLKRILKHRIFNLTHNRRMKQKLLSKMAIKPTDNILDYGCGSGILTLELAKRVPRGKIMAIDIIHEKLKRLSEKTKAELEKHNNVIVAEEKTSVKFPANLFDEIVSGGLLNYLANPLPILKNLHAALRKDGEVAFALKDSWLTPAPISLSSEEKIIETFKSAGFKIITIEQERGFTTYYYIYAKK